MIFKSNVELSTNGFGFKPGAIFVIIYLLTLKKGRGREVGYWRGICSKVQCGSHSNRGENLFLHVLSDFLLSIGR